MPVTVKDVYDVIDEIAPFATQETWDNAGLLAGMPNMPVRRVLCALDLSMEVISESIDLGAELIVTHHPILFNARKNLREDDPEGAVLCMLVRYGKALIAAHTNYDIADGGVNCCLARAIGLKNVVAAEGGLRVGEWEGLLYPLSQNIGRSLGTVVRIFGNPNADVRRVAVCGGAGSSLWKQAYDAGADCFVTGEVRHSDAVNMLTWNMTALEAGHYRTEKPSVKALKMTLQKRFDELQYKVKVFDSDYEPF